jgi:hypothetical protein
MIIEESGMAFVLQEEHTYMIESQMQSLEESYRGKPVEFVLWRRDALDLIEAKQSSPRPGNALDFDMFVDGIVEKFQDSWEFYTSRVLAKKEDVRSSLPPAFRTYVDTRQTVRFLLIINGHKTEWLSPIRDALKIRMARTVNWWNADVVVLNDDLARKYRYIR